MEEKQIYDNFIKLYTINGKNEKYNFNFDINNDEEFENEFQKFICTYNYYFFSSNENGIYTFINSHPCFMNENQLNFLNKLIDGANKRGKSVYGKMILEFLLIYYNSLDSYSHNNRISKDEVNKYKIILLKTISINDFNSNIIDKVISFYENIINYVQLKKIKINISEKERILFNIQKYINRNKRAVRILDEFISEREGLIFLFKYDKRVCQHLDIYKEFCMDTALVGYENDAVIEVFTSVLNKGLFDDSFIKDFINRIIIKTNSIITVINSSEEEYLQIISNIEQTIKNLNNLINNDKLDIKYKEKIKECILKVLHIKRNYIKKKEYTTNFSKHQYEFTIPKGELDKIKEDIILSFAKLYNHTRIDFTKELEFAIKSYSENAILYHVTTINIYDNDVYKIESDYKFNNKYKVYYDKIGKEYVIKNQSKLLNILDKNYFEVMLNYIKTTYMMQIGIIKELLNEQDMRKMKDDIYNSRIYKGHKIENLYIEMMTQIVGIEANIFKLAEQNGIKNNNTENMLEDLFDLFKDNSIYRNGFMYIYYILYCKRGFELRNKVAHGEILWKDDYKEELLMIYSCMIIINYIVGEETNGK